MSSKFIRIFILTVLTMQLAVSAPLQQSDLLSSIKEIQRKFSANINEDVKEEKNVSENLLDDKPEVDVDNIENAENSDVQDEDVKENFRKTKAMNYKKEDLAAEGSNRQNKMFGGYFPYTPYQYPTPYPMPAYYPGPRDYYDDYSQSLDAYPTMGPTLANFQNYPQLGLPNGAGMDNLQNLQNMQNYQNLQNLQNIQSTQSTGNYQSTENLQNLEEEEILSRNNQANRRRPGYKNSPIYYIRLPPTPYMFVPGLGYVSQPPTIAPMTQQVPQYPQLAQAPVTVSPFYQLPINFVSNGKPSGIYQWPAPGPALQPQFTMPYPPRPQRPAYRPNPYPYQDSKITHLKGPFLFNGRPEEIFLLQNSLFQNPLYQNPLNSYY